MEYEFKSFVLAEIFDDLGEGHEKILNNYFKEGWEYMDSICQSYGTALYNDGGSGSVIVVLKKIIAV